MSFVKKAIKKVFKTVKRAVKKVGSFLKRAWENPIVRTAILIAAAYFTAGLINPNFPGWSASWSSNMAAAGGASASFGAKVGVFFQTVGQTISAGSAYINQGISNLFGKGGEATGLAPSTSSTVTDLSGVATEGAGAETVAQALAGDLSPVVPTAQKIGTSIASSADMAKWMGTALPKTTTSLMADVGLSTWGKVLYGAQKTAGKFGQLLMADSFAGTAARWGTIMGMQMYWQNKQYEKEEGYFRGRNIWGTSAFDGGPGWADQIARPRINRTGQVANAPQTPSAAQQMAQGPQQPIPAQAASIQQPGGLLAAAPVPAAQSAQQGLLAQTGVPAQQTQAPPATQPPQGRPPYGVYPEILGVA
jgi:hypothetical protein